MGNFNMVIIKKRIKRENDYLGDYHYTFCNSRIAIGLQELKYKFLKPII